MILAAPRGKFRGEGAGKAAAGVESASPQLSVRLADDSHWARDNHRQAKVDDLFAQWESDPLQLLSIPDLGM